VTASFVPASVEHADVESLSAEVKSKMQHGVGASLVRFRREPNVHAGEVLFMAFKQTPVNHIDGAKSSRFLIRLTAIGAGSRQDR